MQVLRAQLAKAERQARAAEAQAIAKQERTDEDRQQLRVERERSAAAEQEARELRRLLDTELDKLRGELAEARAASERPAAVPAAPAPAPGRSNALAWLRSVLARRRRNQD